MLTQLKLGALQFQQINASGLAASIPIANITFLGFAYKNSEEAVRVMDGPLGAYVGKEIAANRLHSCRSQWDVGMIMILSNVRQVRTPADLRGLKIRVSPTKIGTDLFTRSGGNPVGLNYNEVYTAMQTRLLDATTDDVVDTETVGYYQVAKYLSLTNHAWSCAWLIANGDVWNRLPPDIQEIIERNNRKYCMLARRDMATGDNAVLDKLQRRGMSINPVDQAPFRALLPAYYQEWAANFGPTAWGLFESGVGRKYT